MTDYAKAQRLTYLWLDLALEESRLAESGARSKRHRKQALPEFLEDMSRSINQIARVLKPGRHCVMVWGESPSREPHLDRIEQALEASELRIAERIVRSLPNQRGPIASLSNERILVCVHD